MAECPSLPKTQTSHSAHNAGLPRTAVGRISAAVELKESGNKFYQEGNWRRAAKKYHEALLYVKAVRDKSIAQLDLLGADFAKTTPPISEKERERATSLFVVISNNLAASLLKAERWTNVVHHTSLILEIEPENVKSLYRRGIANMQLGNLDEAKVDLDNALKLNPADASIKKQVSVLQQLRKDHWDKEKNRYKGLFGK